jgi:hypothetical protein
MKDIASLMFNVNYDSDSNSDYAFEFEHVIKLHDFLAENPELADVTCVAIKTGYTDRIINNDDLGFAVCLTDMFSSPKLAPNIKNQKIYDIAKQVIHHGTVVFDDKDTLSVFNRVSELNAADYCSCCNVANIFKMQWFKVGEDVVLVCHVDTESG